MLAINVLGSLPLGVLVGLTWSPSLVAVVAIVDGVLGGFMMFSTFSVEARSSCDGTRRGGSR